jgi:hypothetical protein
MHLYTAVIYLSHIRPNSAIESTSPEKHHAQLIATTQKSKTYASNFSDQKRFYARSTRIDTKLPKYKLYSVSPVHSREAAI